MIPPLDALGLLPAGVHTCTWVEAETAFGFNDHRRMLLAQVRRFVAEQLVPLGLAVPLYLDGSFVRNKPLPQDIDIVLDLSASTDIATLAKGLSLRLCAPQIKRDYHVDLWLRHPQLPEDLVAFFQYAGTEAAAELHLDSKHPKGILRIEQ